MAVRGLYYVPSILSLCDAKGLASNLSISMRHLACTEAIPMPSSLWGIPYWPIPGPESLHLQTKCTFDPVGHVYVQTNHLLIPYSLDKANVRRSKSTMHAFWHSKKKKRKIHSNMIKIKFELQWHAFGLSPRWRQAQMVCSTHVHHGASQGEWFPSRSNPLVIKPFYLWRLLCRIFFWL